MPSPKKKTPNRAPCRATRKKVSSRPDRWACRSMAASLVCGVAANMAEGMKRAISGIATEIAPAIEEERRAWLEETGSPMPGTSEEIMQAAIEAGRSRGLPASHEVIGQYTLADIYEMRAHDLRQRIGIAAAIVEQMKATDPASLIDRYQRAADAMSANGRKVVAGLFNYGATKQSDATTRSVIEEETGLSTPQVKAAIEVEIRRVSATMGDDIIESKASFGTWLSEAGVEVARRIDSRILKR
jgi:hypothetical protein